MKKPKNRLSFTEVPNPGAKTRVWSVRSALTILGTVGWWSHWRRYTFHPSAGTIFDPDCLREIADFCSSKTASHNADLIAKKLAEVRCEICNDKGFVRDARDGVRPCPACNVYCGYDEVTG